MAHHGMPVAAGIQAGQSLPLSIQVRGDALVGEWSVISAISSFATGAPSAGSIQSVDLPGKLRLGHAVKDKDDIRYSTFADTFFQHRARDLAARTCPARQFQHAHFQPTLSIVPVEADKGSYKRSAHLPHLASLTQQPTVLLTSTDQHINFNSNTMFSTVYMTCLLASAALASPVALAPRGFYSSYNNNGRTTDMGHTDATTVTPWGGNTATTDYNKDSRFQNSGTSYGIDPTTQWPGQTNGFNPGQVNGFPNQANGFIGGGSTFPGLNPAAGVTHANVLPRQTNGFVPSGPTTRFEPSPALPTHPLRTIPRPRPIHPL
ncbi:hypothetical protein PSHT_02983 [Puccinia striiformis]|uniref:Uncharacterized protein n=1 Tax=Puccinia striiformis TaxID=27350 RepID=A0A2S4WGN7_9BASI|nr:hypothetical protein PSHT_02983 [Puccinia striiformis]